MAGLDYTLPLQVKAPDMMGMLDQGSKLAQFYTQNKADGELSRIYKETGGDLDKMLEIGKQSPFARYVIPQLQAQKQAQIEAAIKQQKDISEIGKTNSEAFKNNQQGGGFKLENSQKQLGAIQSAVQQAAMTGDKGAAIIGLDAAKRVGLINEDDYQQQYQLLSVMNPEQVKAYAQSVTFANAKDPASLIFTSADNVLDNQTAVGNNIRDNTTSTDNNIRTTQASIYNTDKDYQLGQQELQVKQTLEQQKINIEQNQGEVVAGADGMGYIFYKNRPAGNRYEPLLGQDGKHAKAPVTGQNKGGMSATAQKELFEVTDSISAAQNGIENLRAALNYSKTAYDGFGATQRAAVAGNLTDSEAATATAMLNNIVTGNALEMLKATFGGAPTEGERAILLQLQGSANLPRAQREAIYNRAIQMAERRLQSNQAKAEGIRNGSYFQSQQGGSGTGGASLSYFK
ncbi:MULTISPECIES: hypothetical protein [Acinetobacter]|uniref:hypothetical protein n=1 Tax=Acinetobacter TaxID=469 RepID=UPI00244948C0|nr:hypothetical protein [Acinetobacter baumannii]MDH2644767.1 hypothetical protein [Acinetobacter baumannii]